VVDRDRAARELAWFFSLALGSAALLHGAIALLGFGFSLSAASPALPLYLLGLAGPAAAGLVLSGPVGRGCFLRSVLRPRGSAGVYACALVAQACILLVAWVLSHAGPASAPPWFSVSNSFAFLALGQLWVVLGEELGWRGFALPRLEQVLSPRSATLVLALAWAIWHAPMFFVVGSLQAREPIWLFGLAVFAWSCIHTQLYHRSRPSIVPNLLFHGCTNLTLNLVEVPAQSQTALAAAYALFGLAAWFLLGRTRPVHAAAA
jgi:membrane protease YdiL (CAAX protease family)